jgi:hypothetical protein
MLVKTPHASPFPMEEGGSIFILDKAGKSTIATEYTRLSSNSLAAENGSHYRKGAHSLWLESSPAVSKSCEPNQRGVIALQQNATRHVNEQDFA